jgi:glycosyltransferase involved in cell wall biosynthesis
MKIAIASMGRFHVLDLARELDHLGEDVAFYSYVPRGRAERFGLPLQCHRGLLPMVAPLVAWQHFAGGFLPLAQERAMAHALDSAVGVRLEPCDVFIGMSGAYLAAARHAKRRFGAQIWLERGSRHILSQRDILAGLGARGPSDFIVARELAGYELADRIVVPSTHVAESFAERAPHLVRKLFVNPYGVDIDQFPARPAPGPEKPPTVIFVGALSLQKGADLLIEAIRRLDGVRLIHVGALVDVAFPDDPRFEHVDPVPQWRLKDFYARAHVFALASRQDGFGLVLTQALASGLPLVCTEWTGGPDLRLSRGLAERISVVPCDDVGALSAALATQLDQSVERPVPISEEDRALLTWGAYGRRYQEQLNLQ